MKYCIDAQSLIKVRTRVLLSVGVPQSDASLLADSLVTAERWGHPSHGMLRLPWYVARLRSGAMTPMTRWDLVVDNCAVAVMDGHDGIGQVLANDAARLDIDRAHAHGVSAVAVRNSNHFGIAAYFTRKRADAGCVALLATNASPAMAPWGGRVKVLGTNPWSIAAPAGSRGVVAMDIVNTAVARERSTRRPSATRAFPHPGRRTGTALRPPIPGRPSRVSSCPWPDTRDTSYRS